MLPPAAFLVQASEDSLGGGKLPVFSLIDREWTLAALCWEWVLLHWQQPLHFLWVGLRHLCLLVFIWSSRSLLLPEVGAATSRFSGIALLAGAYFNSEWKQSICVFSTLSGDEHHHCLQLF